MPTLRETRVPVNRDGSVDYPALQREAEIQRFNEANSDPINSERQDRYQESMDRYAAQRALIEEGSITKPYVPPPPPARYDIPTGLWSEEDKAASKANVARIEAENSKPPTVHYATNVGDTKAKWEKEGKKVTFVEDKKDKVPDKPSDDDLLSQEMTHGMYGRWLKSEGYTGDPRKINPAAEGTKARLDHESRFSKPRPGTAEYAVFEKESSEAYKEAHDAAVYKRNTAEERFKEFSKWSLDKDHLEVARRVREDTRRIAAEKAEADKRPTWNEALNQTDKIVNDPGNWLLPGGTDESVIKKVLKGEMEKPRGTRVKPEAINQLNTFRIRAGMQPLDEKAIEVKMQWRNLLGTVTPAPSEYRYTYTERPKAKGGKVPSNPTNAQKIAIPQLAGEAPGRYEVDGKLIHWDGKLGTVAGRAR